MAADEEPGDGERWAQAESILAGQPPVDARQGPWRRRIYAGSMGLGLLSLAFGLAVLLARLVADPALTGGWDGAATGVVSGCGLVLLVVGIALLEPPRYRGRVRTWGSPEAVLSDRQKRVLLDQVVGRRPVDAAHLALARDLAMRRIAQARRQAPLSLSPVLLLLASAIISDDPYLPWLWLVALVVFCVGLVFYVRGLRRFGRFLREHPAPDG